MDPRLQLPDAGAWAHAAGLVAAAPVGDWSTAVDAAVDAMLSGTAPAIEGKDLVAETAWFLLPRVTAWAPGLNGEDPASDLTAALSSAGLDGEHGDVVCRAWATNGKALVAAARKRATAMLTTSGDAEPAFLRYQGAAVRVGRGATATADGAEAASTRGLHEPVMTVALPPTAAGDAAGTQLVLDADAAYALFAEIDKAQRAIDGLFEARAEHSDPSAA